jgi:hypothetical protein
VWGEGRGGCPQKNRSWANYKRKLCKKMGEINVKARNMYKLIVFGSF